MSNHSQQGLGGGQHSGNADNTEQTGVQISTPHIDRPDGPFKHSGETSGWTKEEEVEKEMEEDREQ